MTDINVTHCIPYPHIGETLTVNYLRHHLPHGVLLVNYHLPDVTGTQEIDVRADIYSLGAGWYDMLFRPDADAVIERARIDDAPIPADGKEILRMMLAEPRSERPESMGEVQRWLALLED